MSGSDELHNIVAQEESKGSEHHAKLTPVSKESGKPVELTSVNETPPRCSVQHANQEAEDIIFSVKSYRQNLENIDAEAICVDSSSQRNMTAKRDIREFPYPKKQGMRSARLRGNYPSPWLLPEGFLNSQNELNKHGSSKKRVFTEESNSTSIVPKKELKLMANSCQYDNVELQGTKKDIGEGIDPKSYGKRSIQPRGEKPASFVSLDGLHNFERELKKHVNDQVGLASITVQKVKENNDDAIEQAIAPMILTLAEVKGVVGNADKNTCVPTTNTLKVRESNKQDAIATEQMDVLMTDTTYEFMVSDGTGTKCVVQDSDSWTHTLADLNGSNGASINAAQTAVLTTDAVYSQQGKRNIKDVQSTIFPDLNLDTGAEDFDISSAESLASVYGLSERDPCTEFAVKLLISEIPLPKEAAEVEEFFSQKMTNEKSTI